MEIAAIVPGIKPDYRDARQSPQVPLRSLLKALDDAGIPISKRQLALDALATWGTLESRVVERNPGNEHILDIAGGRISLALTQAHEAGETLLLSLDPRSPGQAAGTNRGSNLSPLSILLGQLTTASVPDELPKATPLASSPARVDDLANGLRSSISQSGLFYESHLAAWAEGKHSLELLLAEPQARMAKEGPLGSGQANNSNQPAEASQPIPENLAPLVRRQLELMDNRIFTWMGEVWPGQSAQMELHPEDQPPSKPSKQELSWSTRVRMQLPNLGAVDALVSIQGMDARINLRGDKASTLSLLKETHSDLAASLSARGIGMTQFSVNPHG